VRGRERFSAARVLYTLNERGERAVMTITVYGPGCAKCTQLEAAARQAVQDLNLGACVEKVGDIVKIAQAGILITPALAIDGAVVLKGRVANAAEIASLITSALDGS